MHYVDDFLVVVLKIWANLLVFIYLSVTYIITYFVKLYRDKIFRNFFLHGKM